MKTMRRLVLLLVVLLSVTLLAQEKEASKTEPEPAKPVFVPPSARLAAAKTAIVVNAGGSEIPYNVIANGIEGWGRLRVVDSRPQADIIIEVTSPDDDTSSVSTKSHITSSGRVEEAPPANRNVNGPVRLAVLDGKTRIVLWAASEQPKGSFRQRTRDDHLVDAAAHLLTKLRERLEPPAPPAAK